MEPAMPNAPPTQDASLVNVEPDQDAQDNAATKLDNTASNNQPTPTADVPNPQPTTTNDENALQYPAVDTAFDVPSEAARSSQSDMCDKDISLTCSQ